MKISRLDHLVLTVQNIEKSVLFYTQVMGMEKVTFGDSRVALLFGNQKINLHEYKQEFEPTAQHPTPGSADLCFVIETPISEAQQHLEKYGVEIIDGPIMRTGAIGQILSIYIRDPDQNLLELSNDIP
jgi:catechol 2,3-dioxygenase-like lactoylglutathione lyase family enzyme